MKSSIDISNLLKKNQKQWRIRNAEEIIRKVEIRLIEKRLSKNIKEIERKLEGLDELEKTVEKLNRIFVKQEIIREME
jgi:hypothetical protein